MVGLEAKTTTASKYKTGKLEKLIFKGIKGPNILMTTLDPLSDALSISWIQIVTQKLKKCAIWFRRSLLGPWLK